MEALVSLHKFLKRLINIYKEVFEWLGLLLTVHTYRTTA